MTTSHIHACTWHPLHEYVNVMFITCGHVKLDNIRMMERLHNSYLCFSILNLFLLCEAYLNKLILHVIYIYIAVTCTSHMYLHNVFCSLLALHGSGLSMNIIMTATRNVLTQLHNDNNTQYLEVCYLPLSITLIASHTSNSTNATPHLFHNHLRLCCCDSGHITGTRGAPPNLTTLLPIHITAVAVSALHCKPY